MFIKWGWGRGFVIFFVDMENEKERGIVFLFLVKFVCDKSRFVFLYIGFF